MELVAGTAAVEHSKVVAGPIVVGPLVVAHIAAVAADPTVAAHTAAVAAGSIVVDHQVAALVAIVDCPYHSYFLHTNTYS